MCREANVQDVLSKNEASLKEIYTHYAKLDNSAGDDNMDEMNLQVRFTICFTICLFICPDLDRDGQSISSTFLHGI
jgi:hypothetical protein